MTSCQQVSLLLNLLTNEGEDSGDATNQATSRSAAH
jgi:hypothetical protein